MNRLIEPKGLLEVRKWKREVSAQIGKYGLREVERRASVEFEKALTAFRKKKKAKTHS